MFEIYSLWNWQFWTEFIFFGIAVFLSWFLAGLIWLSYTKLEKVEKFYLSVIFGMVLWTLQGYILGWSNLRYLTWVYLICTWLMVWRRRRHIFPIEWKIKLSLFHKLIIIIGSLSQLTPLFLSGTRAWDGIQFYFVNIFDGIFHLSLTRSLVESFPPIQPGAAGIYVSNYHFLSNLAVAELARIWHIPIAHMYFQYLPLFMSIWFGILLVLIMRRWTNSSISITTTLILFYFSGELSWFFNSILGALSQVPFEVFIDHGILQFLNPPQAFAKLVFLGMLVLWSQYWRQKSWDLVVIVGIMLGSLVGFKVYFGFLGGLGFILVWLLTLIKLFTYKNNLKSRSNLIKLTVMGSIALIISLAVYFPINKSAGGLFFSFVAWPKLLLGAEKIWWNEWWLRLQVYQAANNFKALIVWYGLAIGIFLVSIFHLRLIGLISFFKKFRGKMELEEVVFLLFPSVICIFLGMNFLQISGGFNTFNFFVVSLVPLNILTALSFSRVKSRSIKWLIISLLAVTTIQSFPLQYHFIHNSVVRRDRQVISPDHEEALQFIGNQGSGLVQTLPQHYLDETTPYVFFFTGKYSYLGGRGILDSHNQPTIARKKVITDLFSATATISAQIALDHEINTVLLSKKQIPDQIFFNNSQISPELSMLFPHWKLIFENKEIILLIPEEKIY